jgi:uncharacterized membrane protein YjgN (DUF898 family)
MLASGTLPRVVCLFQPQNLRIGSRRTRLMLASGTLSRCFSKSDVLLLKIILIKVILIGNKFASVSWAKNSQPNSSQVDMTKGFSAGHSFWRDVG